METLANLESFIYSADCGGFSAAARRLGLTPAAVSRNVAVLEHNLGVRLFQRSTHSLTLTEDDERFLASATTGVEAIQMAIADVTTRTDIPAGMLKVSLVTVLAFRSALLQPEVTPGIPRMLSLAAVQFLIQ